MMFQEKLVCIINLYRCMISLPYLQESKIRKNVCEMGHKDSVTYDTDLLRIPGMLITAFLTADRPFFVSVSTFSLGQ